MNHGKPLIASAKIFEQNSDLHLNAYAEYHDSPKYLNTNCKEENNAKLHIINSL